MYILLTVLQSERYFASNIHIVQSNLTVEGRSRFILLWSMYTSFCQDVSDPKGSRPDRACRAMQCTYRGDTSQELCSAMYILLYIIKLFVGQYIEYTKMNGMSNIKCREAVVP
jgi:hypothetical protein